MEAGCFLEKVGGGSKSVKSLPPDVILSPKCIKSVEFLSGVQLILIRRICRHTAVVTFVNKSAGHLNAQGDGDVISMLAGFRRHLVGKTLINVFHCSIAEIRFVGKLVIIRTFS